MSDADDTRMEDNDDHSPAPSSEGEGVDLRAGAGGGEDSSEEEQTDSEEERQIRKGFIVDEDDAERRRHRKKRRKERRAARAAAGEGDEGEGGEGGARESRKRRKDSEDEAGDLDEDDLELLQENLGMARPSKSKNKLKRLRRRRRSASASSDGGSGSPRHAPGDLRDIFNDVDDDDEPRAASGGRRGSGGAGAGIENLFDADEMAGFIEDDTDESRSDGGGSDEDGDDSDAGERRRRRKEKKRRERKEQARKRRGLGMGRVEGINAEAWGEVAEVFGNGMEYAWAMEDEDEEEGEKGKELKDIFEPSEIASRMLTEEDEKIRATDVPERLQLANAGLPPFAVTSEGELEPLIPPEELRLAALWMSDKISPQATMQHVLKDAYGNPPPLADEFLSAVENVVRFLNVDFLEPPHIWHHRSDYLFHAPSGEQPRPILVEADLWRIAALSTKYRAFLARRRELLRAWALAQKGGSVSEQDRAETDDMVEQLQTVDEVADAQAWVALHYGALVREARESQALEGEGEGAEGEGEKMREREGPKRPKRATREGAYEQAKKTAVSKLAEAIGVPPRSLALDVASGTKTHYADDPPKAPLDLADEYAGTAEYPTADRALDAAKGILVHELGAEPLLRKEVRRFFRDFAVVNVEATKAGEAKIDQLNPFYAFKYLNAKPLKEFLRSPQWLQILAAESEGLVNVAVVLPPVQYDALYDSLRTMYVSDYTSALAEEWNVCRCEVLKQAVDEVLLPEGEKWARSHLREEAEELVAAACRRKLETRLDAAPWCRGDGTMNAGDTPSVLAFSNGNGDPKRDSVVAVFLDADGHFREHVKVDQISNDMDAEQRKQLVDLLKRRRPQVLVVGGFRPAADSLMRDVRELADQVMNELLDAGIVDDEDEEADETTPMEEKLARKRNRAAFESTFVYDDVARIYQNSARAAQEFTELSTLGKYCVGLARYVQSPLNEYAALGADMTALTYDPNQKFLSKEKLALALERSMIVFTNRVGVDINRAVRNQYYGHLLPYVSGLGPRKAESVVKKINASGGTLTTRSGLVMHQIMTKNIWVNASAFLRIRQDDLAADLGRDTENEEDPDPLDDTRIHPEDYDVARKMAADAMEYDEEDLEGAQPSKAVTDLLEDDVNKLNELALDEFAEQLSKVLQQPKRLTLYRIREELQRPFNEKRTPFAQPTGEERFVMFTGETRQTLDQGLVIPVRVLRVDSNETVIVRLDCGIEGHISQEFRTSTGALTKLRPGQTLQAVVMDVRYQTFTVDLTTQEELVAAGDLARRTVPVDTYFDKDKADAAMRVAGRQQQRQQGRVKRQIKHPNFQDVSSGKAEELLSNGQRGDCVIRPSSKEDHLAVTWKVDEGLYQHIAVHELNKPNEYTLGTQLRVDERHKYSDLDELIDAHIKQMARKVNELTNSDRFKGKKDQLDKFLQTWTLANPGKSIYAFGWDDDRRKPGQILLGFRTNQNAPINYWSVIVQPEGYLLKGQVHGDLNSLANAFKLAYSYSMQGNVRQAAPGGGKTPYMGGKTPGYGGGGGRTPAPQSGRTPNPYQQQQQGGGYGGGYGGGAPGIPGLGGAPGQGYGGRTPNPAYGQYGPR
ncbi:hypothetical protein JCM10207_005567 [Rhodosporidiobolus poonsookiae]